MGQVTIFVKDGCIHCKRVFEMLEKFRGCVMKELKDKEGVDPEILIKTVDCGAEVAYAAFCIRTTGTFTVPHVFFNESYVGSAEMFLSLDMTCKGGYNVLRSKLLNLAQHPIPDPPFPPPPDAAMVKVTDELAFSTQPTTSQLKALHTVGLRSVLNILRPDSPAFHKGEDEMVASTGVEYKSVPVYVVTGRNLEKALAVLKGLPKPVLIHDDTGKRACLLALLEAARQMNEMSIANGGSEVARASTVCDWGRDLGMDLKSFLPSIEDVLGVLKEEIGNKQGDVSDPIRLSSNS